MVWGLFPVDPFPGAQTYYIFSKGTYKVGRKDCDVVIQADRAVSRLHAEIIVNEMSNGHSRSSICVRDHSKFGTFVNKEQGSKAVHSCPHKEATVKDGDVITFGTGNASFRLCFVTLVIFLDPSNVAQVDTSFQEIILSLGAHATYKWSLDCTHMLVKELSTVTPDLIDAVIAEKSIVLDTWLKVLTGKGISNEFPDCCQHCPTISVYGTPVKVVEPKVREKCLDGHTFFLDSVNLFSFRDKLASLLKAFGAQVVHAGDHSACSQISAAERKRQYVLVHPSSPEPDCNRFHPRDFLAQVNEADLIRAVLSGHFEIPKVKSSPIIVSSSHSTDETMVADSDIEGDTAASNPATSLKLDNAVKLESDEVHDATPCHVSHSDKHDNLPTCGSKDEKDEVKESFHRSTPEISTEKQTYPSSGVQDGGLFQRRLLGDDHGSTEHQNTDIIFSQDLIVRNISAPAESLPEKEVVDFKRFRKTKNLPATNYNYFIPFAKDPYSESEFQNNDVSAYMREEKKRKQMEAVAEDLFNSSKKAKKDGRGSGSLQAFLTRV